MNGLTPNERDWLRTAMDLDCDLNANDDHLFASVERIVADRERAALQHAPVAEGVVVSTLHSAKGLEWEIVHMIGLTEGYLPISYAQTEAEIREEKRLMYVGITRAKREITLTWAKRDATSTRDREPSRFFNQLLARG